MNSIHEPRNRTDSLARPRQEIHVIIHLRKCYRPTAFQEIGSTCKTVILPVPVALYGYETWSFTLSNDRGLRVFENKVF